MMINGAVALIVVLLVTGAVAMSVWACTRPSKRGQRREFCGAWAMFSPLVAGLLVFAVLDSRKGLVAVLNDVLPAEQARLAQRPVSVAAKALHSTLFVADMHADSLLWASLRPLEQRADYGHVDVPRLIEGNVAVQAFTVVTASPKGQNFDRNAAPRFLNDSITSLGVLAGWPLKAVRSRAERFFLQARQLGELERAANGQFHWLRTRQDVRRYVALDEKRRTVAERNFTAGFLGIEGLHALEGDLANVERFFSAGARMAGITHFFDNKLGGSAHGLEQGGLTLFGRRVVEQMMKIGMMIDISHASHAVVDDILELAEADGGARQGTVMASHMGSAAVCPSPRNLDDARLRRVVATGGIVSVGFFSPALCGDDLMASLVATLNHLVEVLGEDAVALGSDWDGTVWTPFAADGMVHLTQALMDAHWSHERIAKVMGDNVKRLLLENLPDEN